MWNDNFLEEMKKMKKEMDRMSDAFSRFFISLPRMAKSNSKGLVEAPISKMTETGKNIIVTFKLPGIDKKDIDLNIDDRNIEISVKKSKKKEIKKKGKYGYAAEARSYYQLVTLPTEVQASKAKAEYKKGVLRIEIPKVKKVERKKIQVK